MGAGNQQERLIKLGWVVGFVDGEGCFSIGFIKQPNRKKRRGYKTGYQVSHEFVVTQGAKSFKSLCELAEFFKVGHVVINNRHDNHKEHLYRYVVKRRKDLLNLIIPFFRRYKMRSAKQIDFEKFAQCVELMQQEIHLTRDGLIKIATIAQTMNRKKSRTSLIRILRDHTLDT